jgi:nitroreductase
MSPTLDPRLSVLYGRRSIREYEAKPVGDELVTLLLSAAMAAPSACGKDPWHFVVVRQKTMLGAISAVLPSGKMLASAALGIVVCGDLGAAHASELSYLLQDCSAAIENLLVAAHALGLGACWLGVHPRQARVEALTKLLALPDRILPISCIAIGWPSEQKSPRTRYQASHVHDETW